MIIRFIIPILLSMVVPLASHGAKKPNVIYIYADDLGYGELGAYGQQKIMTPNLDRLAAEGMRFTDHYTGAPVCAPARCILLTGRHSGHSYIRGNYELGGFEDEREGGQMPLPEGSFTIGHLMKKAGYVTGAVGKWGLGVAGTTGHPNLQGFDYFYGYLDQKQAHNYYPTHLWENDRWDTLHNPYIYVHRKLDSSTAVLSDFDTYMGKDYAMDRLTAKAEAFIRKYSHEPFFLYLPFPAPHVSLQVPAEAVAMYRERFADQPYWGQRSYTPVRYPRASYAALITYLDAQIGKILALLKELRLEEHTIVMFSSDNGTTFDVGGVDAAFFNSTGGLRGRKMELYEGGIREPFIVRWPGKVRRGTVSGHVSAQYDLLPTLAELTGTATGYTDGISFLPTLLGRNEGQKRHPYLYFEYGERTGQVAVRMGNWKAIRSYMRKDPDSPWELYDLATDPFETTDLARLHPDVVDRCQRVMREAHQPAHIKEWEFIMPKFDAK